MNGLEQYICANRNRVEVCKRLLRYLEEYLSTAKGNIICIRFEHLFKHDKNRLSLAMTLTKFLAQMCEKYGVKTFIRKTSSRYGAVYCFTRDEIEFLYTLLQQIPCVKKCPT